MELPQFVKLNHSCLRLVKGSLDGVFTTPSKYVRDAGNWDVRFKVKSDKVYVHAPNEADPMRRYNNVELIPTTKEEWEADNGEHAPQWLRTKPK